MPTLDMTETFTIVACCDCGINFGMPQSYCDKRHEDGQPWFCPNGHSQVFTKTVRAELDQARRELGIVRAQVRHADDQRQAAERSNSALRAAATRAKKRAAAGVCPCCQRSFTQLTRHMQAKHPGYVQEATQDA